MVIHRSLILYGIVQSRTDPRSDDHEFRPMSTLKDQIEAAEMGERVPGLSPGFGYEVSMDRI